MELYEERRNNAVRNVKLVGDRIEERAKKLEGVIDLTLMTQSVDRIRELWGQMLTMIADFHQYATEVGTDASAKDSGKMHKYEESMQGLVTKMEHRLETAQIETAQRQVRREAVIDPVPLRPPQEGHSIVGSVRSTTSSAALLLKQAQAHGARAKIAFARKEAELRIEENEKEAGLQRQQNEIQRQQDEMQNQQREMEAALKKQQSERDIKLELMKEEKEAAAVVAEAEFIEQALSDVGDVGLLPEVPRADPIRRTAEFVNQLGTINPIAERAVYSHTPPTRERIPRVDEDDAAAVALSRCIVKREVLVSRLTMFNDKPERFAMWQNMFKDVVRELKLSANEELDLLVKWLGSESSQYAVNIRTASVDPLCALQRIWERLDMRYGSPEMVETGIKRRLSDFPALTPKDSVKLFDLSDLVQEIACLKEDTRYCKLLAYFDASSGANVIVDKLPYHLRTRWAKTAFDYKTKHEMIYPPLTVLAKFLRDMSQFHNDPSIFPQGNTTVNETKGYSRYGNARPNTIVHTKKTEVLNSVIKPQRICPIHRSNHTLDVCDVFKRMSIGERQQYLKENSICSNCCVSKSHNSSQCTVKLRCTVCNASRHATAMHYYQPSNSWRSDQGASSQSWRVHGGEPTSQQNHVAGNRTKASPVTKVNTKCTEICEEGAGKSCAKIVLVKMYSADCPQNSVTCYAILDDQSNRSLVRSKAFDLLGLAGKPVEYNMNSCSGSVTTSGRRAENCVVQSLDGSVTYGLPTLIECEQIPNNRSEICTPQNAKVYSHLNGMSNRLPELNNEAEILILLGRDTIDVHQVHEQITGPAGTPFAQLTSLGWVVIGQMCLGSIHAQTTVNVYKTHVLPSGRPSLFKACDSKFSIEENIYDPIFGRTVDDNKPSLSCEDRQFLDMMNCSMEQDENNRWVAPLPFRESRKRLPDSRRQALKRADILDISLRKNPVKKKHFFEFMEKIIGKGQAELAPELLPGEECWYLPIFGVYHPQKPNQIRGVFDSSAEVNGLSLNSVLLSGPDLTNNLLGVLMRFRREPVAVIADIEQMFYCFGVKHEHRNFLRFFWYRDNKTENQLVEYRMCKHVFGNSPSPAIATYGLRKAVEDSDSDVKCFVSKDFYVDDGLTSQSTAALAVDLIKRTQIDLLKSGIRLHKIASNETQVMAAFPPDDLAKGLNNVNFENENLPSQRSLGVTWNLNRDAFAFQVDMTPRPETKRGILSTVNSIFDPIGFLAPIVLVGKLILREVVIENNDWDTPVSPQIRVKWKEWVNNLTHLTNIHIPRCYFQEPLSTMHAVKLCIFSDASEKAISAVAYLVASDEEGVHKVSFVLGKSKVAPTHGHTIPRLELCAAVLAAEICQTVIDNIDVELNAIHFYTDSRVVLGYINNQSRRFFTYVSNRVQRILHASEPCQWRYVATEMNPADIGSRGSNPLSLNESEWLWGPRLLYKQEEEILEVFPLIEPNDDKEIRVDLTVLATHVSKVQTKLGCQRFAYFSSWARLITGVACLLHIVKSVSQKLACKGWHSCDLSNNVNTRQASERFIVKQVQREAYENEISNLHEHKNISRESMILNLDPILDEGGLIRVGGRLKNSLLGYSEMHPIIIPKSSHVAKLLIRHYHELVKHQGRIFTEGAVRSAGYWIVGGKRLVTEVIFNCVTCKKLRGRFLEQKMSDLPVDRVERTIPFTYVGVDVFGPWQIVTRRTRGGQATSKRWAVMFTCLTIRAVHIEVIEEMTSSAFINALRRFISIRGPVKQYRSDRGTNFVGATDLIDIVSINVGDVKMKRFLRENQSVWLFNAPKSSHMGGSWERMIGITRRILNAMLIGVSNLTHDVFVTFMAEVTTIINARPLVPTSSDKDQPEVLSASSLLTQKIIPDQMPIGDMCIKVLYKDQWRRVQFLADQFWQKWKREYLLLLQSRVKWQQKVTPLEIGDIVLLRQDDVRNHWPMGIVTNVFPSSDKLIRKVEVRITEGGVMKSFVRPVCELILLLNIDEQKRTI